MLSSIALRRKAGIHEFTDDFVRSPPVQAMMAKVRSILDPEIEAQGFEKIRSIVEVELEDGTVFTQAADERYRGGPDRPFTREELHGKFTECAEALLPAPAIAETLATIEAIEDLPDIGGLVRVMAGADDRAGSTARS
jgi:2-methylcitrate dehydratase PrpD